MARVQTLGGLTGLNNGFDATGLGLLGALAGAAGPAIWRSRKGVNISSRMRSARVAKAGGAPGGQPFPTQGYAPSTSNKRRKPRSRRARRRMMRARKGRRIFRRRVQKAMYPLFASQVLNQNSAFSFSTTNGRQSIKLLEDIGTPSHIATLITGGSLNQNSQAQIFTQRSDITVTNQCNDNVWVEFYYCTPRQDLSTSVYTNVNTIITSGYTDVGSTGAELVYGTSLYDNPKFVNLFKINSVRKVLMSAGTVHRLTLRAPRRSLLASENDTGDFVDKYTRVLIIKFHGSPLNGVSGDGQDTTVSVGPVKLDFIVHRTYRFKHIDVSQRSLIAASNLTQVTTPHIMQASGNVSAVNEANA